MQILVGVAVIMVVSHLVLTLVATVPRVPSCTVAPVEAVEVIGHGSSHS